MEQYAKQLAHIHFHAVALCKLFKDAYPRIQVGGTVITVYHRHRIAAGRRHDIKFLIGPGQIVFQNSHTEDGSTRGYIAGTPCNAVGSRHTRTCVSFRRTHRDTCLQGAARI